MFLGYSSSYGIMIVVALDSLSEIVDVLAMIWDPGELEFLVNGDG